MTEYNLSSTVNRKVLFITHNYIRRKGDFAGVFLHLLASKLVERGIEVSVVAPHDAGIPEFEEIDGVKIYRFRYGTDSEETLAYRGNMHRQVLKNPFKLFTLKRFVKTAYQKADELIKKEKISAVSVHWVIPNGFVGYDLAKKYGDRIRLYLHSHGTDIRLLTRYYLVYLYFKPILNKFDRWTVVSNFLKRLVLERDIYKAGKIEVIPLPNDEKLFYPDKTIAEDPNLILSVSRLTVQKRLDVLIQAIGILKVKLPQIRVEIYGDGPEKQKLLDKIKSLELEDRIKILKPVSQEKLREVYNRAAMVVLNSVDEGFGLSLTEAMLCGRPVIGTDSGGITDIIEDRETGLLVEEDSPRELAGAIEEYMVNPALRQLNAKAGYKKAMSDFSSAALANRYAELYKYPVG